MRVRRFAISDRVYPGASKRSGLTALRIVSRVLRALRGGGSARAGKAAASLLRILQGIVLLCIAVEGGSASAKATQSSPECHAAAKQGREATLHLVVFAGPTPAAGVEVFVEERAAAVTTEHGSVVIELAGDGEKAIGLRIPREFVPDAAGAGPVVVPVTTLRPGGGRTVEVVATFAPDGTVQSVDVEGGETAQGPPSGDVGADGAAVRMGTVTGIVRALEGRRPVARAKVYVRGAQVEATTDVAGRFSVELPEGTWDLSVIHADFSTESRSAVTVSAAETLQLDIELAPASVTLDDFVIRAPHVMGSIAAAMDERRGSASLTDAITAEDISRTGAGDAASAAQRVVGVTVVDGSFVYVRGLGERYTNALVNGSSLPSPEPDKATVPLDLFPTQTIRSIDIAKTFTPDVPADFAGGSVRIETITVPEKMILSGSLKSGWNRQATFRDRLSSPGSPTDWLGFDSGMRRLPGEVPRDYMLSAGQTRPDGQMVTRDELASSGPVFSNSMATTTVQTPVNHGGSMMLGNGWDLGPGTRFGALGALTYSRKYLVRDEIIREFTPAGQGSQEDLATWIDATSHVARDVVRWGAFGSLGLELGKDHQLSLIGLRSQLSDNTTQLFQGFYANNDGTIANTRFDFTSRAMTFGQLRGVHGFPTLKNASLDWRASLARASLDQPDMRDVVYFRSEGQENFVFLGGPPAGRHFFADMNENARAAFVDWTQPLVEGELQKKVKVGGAVSSKDRIFKARRFSFRRVRGQGNRYICGPEFDSERCPGELFTPENQDGSVLELSEDTELMSDAYAATSMIHAAYLMGDANITRALRVIGGARVESTRIRLVQYDQFARRNVDTNAAHVDGVDLLPSLSATYGFGESVALRGALTRTLARPQLREIAPFTWQDYYGGVQVAGNPELEQTYIVNADLRLDIYPSKRELISFSVFAKDFTNPIEPVLQPSSSVNFLKFQNAEGAVLYGAELEARKSLDFVHPGLADLALMGNLAVARSEIRVRQTGGDESGIGFITNTQRSMVNQAPYVVNVALDYAGESTQARILYNVSGRRIVTVGTLGLDDLYLQPQHQFDITFSRTLPGGLRLDVAAENILNAPYLITQGKERREDRATRLYRNGTTLALSVGYAYD